MTPRRRVLCAPDSFKGTFSAIEVADAMARGVERAGAEADRCPVADGGEGTMDVLVADLGGETREIEARDPLGRPITARFALLGDGRRAVVEMAEASGLRFVAKGERDAEAASTYGTGQLIAAAAAAGAREVLVAVGGSATTDGGAGACEAIEDAGGLGDVRLVVLCDVRTPFERAAEVYGPQKGADPAAVERLTARLHALAERLPRDPRGEPMTGAAGGLSGGLWATYGARLVPGAAFVLDAVGFDERARASWCVIAGEGRIDRQTLEGKIVGEMGTRCRQAGIPFHVVVGASALDGFELRLIDVASIQEAGTVRKIAAAAERVVREG